MMTIHEKEKKRKETIPKGSSAPSPGADKKTLFVMG